MGVVTNVENLSGSIWTWYRDNGSWNVRKVIQIDAEPADADALPPLLQGFGAVPPLITDINLSLDDRFLYVSCWGTGELRQYDVSDPFNPELGKLGATGRNYQESRTSQRPGAQRRAADGRDQPGRAAALSNQLPLSGLGDAQFYPEGIRGWAAKIDAGPDGGIAVDPDFLVDFGDERPHQIRLQGGDSSSDTFCYPD